MFDEKSMVEWINGLQGREKDYVKWFANRAIERDDNDRSPFEIMIDARKALILRKAIGVISYATLKTPSEVYKELTTK